MNPVRHYCKSGGAKEEVSNRVNERVRKLLKGLEDKKVDAFLVSKKANLRWLTNFGSDSGWGLVSQKERCFFTGFLSLEEAKHRITGFKVKRIIKGDFPRLLKRVCARLKIKRLGFEDTLSYCEYARLKETLKPIELVSTRNLLEGIRAIKEPGELNSIRKAAEIVCKTFEFLLGFVRPGLTEKEITDKIDLVLRANGAEKAAFEPIVASGVSSSMPHYTPAKERKLRPDDMVLVDFGATYRGYNSDLTRIFFLGRISRKRKDIYEVVRAAQKRAIAKVKPGISASKIDKKARDVIAEKGLADFFGHSTGHGIGLEVHEPPVISSGNDSKLKPGMVFTIEPGIYIPGWGGIRLEDMVLVTETGCEVLTADVPMFCKES